MTASPEELRLMLYEGAVKFCRQGKAAMDKNDFEASYESLMRAQKIVLELSTSLKRDTAPDICDKLTALYTFIYRKLVDANMHRNPADIDEAIKLLEFERDTWKMAMNKAADEMGGSGVGQGTPGAQQTAISSLSQSA